MRNWFLWIAITAFFSLAHPVFSESSSRESEIWRPKSEKIYISPQQLKIADEGIFVKFREVWFKTESLFSDGNGIYIHDLSPQEMGCREGYWPCRNCDRCVKWHYDICPHCNKPT